MKSSPPAPTLGTATATATATGLAVLGLCASLGASGAWALGPADDSALASRIVQVKVYPGSATVERSLRVAAGTRRARIECLPAGLDPQSLQVVAADPAVQLGETTVRTLPRSQVPGCAAHPLDGRIRALEDRVATLAAQRDALSLVTGYLKGLGGDGAGDGGGRRAASPTPRDLAATAQAMQRTGQEALLRQHQLARQQEALERELTPLRAERERAAGEEDAPVAVVAVALDAPRDTELRLSYQVAGPGWTPAYRASLDTVGQRLRIERLAQVAQATGEDWRGVRLVLSTGQPQRGTAGRTPTPWRLGLADPRPEPRGAAMMAAPAAPAPPMERARADAKAQAPLFDMVVDERAFATEFTPAQTVDVPSSGERVSLVLGRQEEKVALVAQLSPSVSTDAFLLAEFAPPSGVWPTGAMQLYRDGAFVGRGRFEVGAEPRMSLSFGRDELLRVQAEPERDTQGSAGLVGGDAQRRVQRAWRIDNQHRQSIAVRLLEAAPVAVDERVKVQASFSPEPAEREWKRQPGMAMWSLDLAAGQSVRVTADYQIRWPKEGRLQGR